MQAIAAEGFKVTRQMQADRIRCLRSLVDSRMCTGGKATPAQEVISRQNVHRTGVDDSSHSSQRDAGTAKGNPYALTLPGKASSCHSFCKRENAEKSSDERAPPLALA